MNVADRMIYQMRTRLDFLITDCYRYMRKHEPEKFKTECAHCTFRVGEEMNGDRCGMEFHELQRIVSMLRGIGLTDRYQRKRKGTYQIRNKYGRIVFSKGE